MKRIKNIILRNIIIIVASVIVAFGAYMLFYGIPLWGLPDEGDIVGISIQDTRYGTEPQVFTDREMIVKARKLADFANYSLGTPDGGEALVTIHYQLEDGQMKTISSSETTVWWQGQAYKIRQASMLVNLAEGLFFAEKPE